MTQFSSADMLIDVRDVIARVEELRDERDSFDPSEGLRSLPTWEEDAPGEAEELRSLEELLKWLKGCGGDEQWEGDWYPITLIHADHFTDAMKELLEDCGDIPKALPSYIAIDWEATAENLRVDYSCVGFDGATYWYR